jgi:hypothetical protein
MFGLWTKFISSSMDRVAGWSPEELWRAYIHLSEAEAAFRI